MIIEGNNHSVVDDEEEEQDEEKEKREEAGGGEDEEDVETIGFISTSSDSIPYPIPRPLSSSLLSLRSSATSSSGISTSFKLLQ